MALPATDSFTAASDAPLQTYSANWTILSGAFTVSAAADAVYPSSANNECGAIRNDETFAADQYAQATLGNVAGFDDAAVGVAVRGSAGGNYYGAYYSSGGNMLYLFKMVGGAWTELAAIYLTPAAGDTLRLEVVGTTLTAKRNGTAALVRTDSSLTSGKPGISGYHFTGVARLLDWEGGNLGGSGVTVTPANAAAGATAVAPTVVRGAISTTPANAAAAAAAIAPTIVLGAPVTVTPTFAASTAAAIAPTVALGSPVTVTPAHASAAASAVAPTVIRGAITVIPGAGNAATSARFVLLCGATTAGVLVQSATNGRYFENDSGPVVLSGFHTWYEFQDGGLSYPPTAFDYAGWLDYLDARGANLHKMWVMETARQWADADAYFYPMPYQRTGPGNAADGRLKFDLTLYEQEYFDRLRERVILAGNRGHYVVVQLFQGWQVESKGLGYTPFAYHPYNAGNNINSIDGDTDNDGAGEETRETSFAAVYNLQKAYVAKVIDTLNDLDNVLWEISNEDTSNSVAWQHALIDYIHTYEAGKPKQHPVGMTVIWPGGSDSDLTSSNAEWISPNNGNSLTPGTAGGTQVVLFDTDHLVGLTTEHEWIWQSFTRGYNPVYMDVYDGALYGADQRADASHERIRNNLGAVLDWAAQIDLANATPQNSLSSTGYCLAKTTGQYQLVAYQPTSGSFTVNLAGISGTFAVTWLRTAATTPTTADGGTVNGGATRTLTPPWSGEDAAALLLIVGVTLTPAQAGAAGAAVAPTVILGAISLTPAAAASAGAVVAPAVVLGAVTVTPATGAASAAAIAPTVILGALAVTPATASAAATATTPSVVLGAITLTPAAALAEAAAAAPTVVLGALTIAPDAAVGAGAAVEPTVILGVVTAIPDAAASAAQAIAPSVVIGAGTIVPDAASAATAAIAPVVVLGAITLTPEAATVGATAIAPTVAEGEAVIVTPASADTATAAVAPLVVLGAIVLAPDAATSGATAAEPVVILGAVTVAPDAAAAMTAAILGAVQEGAAVTVLPDAAAAAASAGAPVVVMGPVSITPATAGAQAAAPNPAVVIGLIVAVTTLYARRSLALRSNRSLVLTYRR
jgi:hypothetical protein